MNPTVKSASNSDKRQFKATTKINDGQTKFIQRLLDELGLQHLTAEPRKWEAPKRWMIRYSTVSDEHKEAMKRRQNNGRR